MILHYSSEGMSKSSIKGSRDQFSQKATENLRKHPSIDQPNHQSIRLGTGSKWDGFVPRMWWHHASWTWMMAASRGVFFLGIGMFSCMQINNQVVDGGCAKELMCNQCNPNGGAHEQPRIKIWMNIK